jgi:hypothetical protein
LDGNDGCSGQTLLTTETCTFHVVFSPASAGSKSTNLSISSNDPYTPILNFYLTGTGTDIVNPVPKIKVNGSSGSSDVARGENFSVTIEIDPGSFNGQDVDWWVLMEYRKRWYYYDASTMKWRRGFSVYHKGQLEYIGPVEIHNISRLKRGGYKFQFGVDTNMNGIQDTDQYYYDTMTVNIQ